MRDLSPELVDAARHIDVVWDAAREARALEGMARLQRGRARQRVVLLGGAATLAVGLVLHFSTGPATILIAHAPAAAPAIASDVPAPVVASVVRDGGRRIGERSQALPGLDAVLELADRRPTLRRGQAHFVIDEVRPLRIAAGSVVIEARAARFGVSVDRRRVHVQVDEGRVVVLEGGQRTELGEGEATFPSSTEAESSAPAAAPIAPTVEPHRPGWRELAAEGDYDRAREALRAETRPPADATQLLLAADVARLSHHPAEALAPLRQILDEHVTDPRAQLAAFTLGRVLLDELGRPIEAAEAFARAEALAPAGPLSEDAVAREVEAWSRAGEIARARERAEIYLRRFPDGRRARSVRRFGALD